MRGRGLTFIDEVELQASSLCSGYSHVASVFQELFVWYGRGSPDEETRVALQYAESLSRSGSGAKRKVVHMLEGAETALWKDIMGNEEEYASANVCVIMSRRVLSWHKLQLTSPALRSIGDSA